MEKNKRINRSVSVSLGLLMSMRLSSMRFDCMARIGRRSLKPVLAARKIRLPLMPRNGGRTAPEIQRLQVLSFWLFFARNPETLGAELLAIFKDK